MQNTVLFTFIILLHILFHHQKVSFYNKIPLFIVPKNCFGNQFTSFNLHFTRLLQPMEVWRMFYVLKVYWLSCNNSCAESSSPFEHAKNWLLKKRLDTNLCQVLIDVKYTRDWQLGLKKNLQDWVVKPITFTTHKMKFSVKNLYNRCE